MSEWYVNFDCIFFVFLCEYLLFLKFLFCGLSVIIGELCVLRLLNVMGWVMIFC